MYISGSNACLPQFHQDDLLKTEKLKTLTNNKPVKVK
jgi:hypothetical protein